VPRPLYLSSLSYNILENSYIGICKLPDLLPYGRDTPGIHFYSKDGRVDEDGKRCFRRGPGAFG